MESNVCWTEPMPLRPGRAACCYQDMYSPEWLSLQMFPMIEAAECAVIPRPQQCPLTVYRVDVHDNGLYDDRSIEENEPGKMKT